MDRNEIVEGLSKFCTKVSSETQPFTFNSDEGSWSSLATSQVGTRGNSVWKTANYVIIGKDSACTKPKSELIEGWRKFAHPDQLLIFEESIGQWEVYSSDKVLLGKNSFLTDLLKKKGVICDLTPRIFYGAPGTGKTYCVQNEICPLFDDGDKFLITLHQSYCYEDFVEGLKPKLNFNPIQYEMRKGIFWRASERAAILAGYPNFDACLSATVEDRRNKFNAAISHNKIVLLCLDEINRCNVSSVFGELISLIEFSKRLGSKDEMIVTLPYSQDKFGVPSNLFIVGTMNTADRSIQLLDSALRRRFTFQEIKPDYDKLTTSGAPKASALLKKINSKLRVLLDDDHQIGHSYFINTRDNELSILNIMLREIIPLLQDYFYGDTDKIRIVLGEKTDSSNNFYVKDIEANEVYREISDAEEGDKEFYKINEKLLTVKNKTTAKKYLHNLLP